MTKRIEVNPKWPWAEKFDFNLGIRVGNTVYVSGSVAWDPDGNIVGGDDMLAQSRQAFANTIAVLAEAGAGPEHIVRITWYVGDKAEYLGALKDVGAAYRDIIGRHYPAMAVIEVKGFVEAGAKMEMEATAVMPA